MASFTVTVSGDYAVEITLNDCTVTSECINVEIVSNYIVSLEPFKVYPNLTNGILFIENGSNTSNKTSIEIFNANGQLVQTHNKQLTQKMQLELEGPSGIYFIKISSNEKTGVYKIYKN